ncbi:MAG: acyl carrier protein [Acidobacteria bacterium]|nr:acyl carrier protein [Acidobacteriota bacterium]
MADTVKSDIKSFIISNFLFGNEGKGIADNQSFLESGLIDSTGMLELVSFIESQYGISVADRELVPENLDSLDNISAYVARKQVGATA